MAVLYWLPLTSCLPVPLVPTCHWLPCYPLFMRFKLPKHKMLSDIVEFQTSILYYINVYFIYIYFAHMHLYIYIYIYLFIYWITYIYIYTHMHFTCTIYTSDMFNHVYPYTGLNPGSLARFKAELRQATSFGCPVTLGQSCFFFFWGGGHRYCTPGKDRRW